MLYLSANEISFVPAQKKKIKRLTVDYVLIAAQVGQKTFRNKNNQYINNTQKIQSIGFFLPCESVTSGNLEALRNTPKLMSKRNN